MLNNIRTIIKKTLSVLRNATPWSIGGFIIGAAGLILGFSFSPWLLGLTGFSCFMLPMLRITGLIDDWDEFRLEAYKTAALVSYAITGIYLITMVMTIRAQVVDWTNDTIVVNLIVTLIMTFYLTYYFQFWDGLKAGRFLSAVILFFWFMFIVLSSFDAEHGGLVAFGMEFLAVLLPLIVSLVLSGRMPLYSGLILLLASIGHLIFFDAYESAPVAFLLPVPELLAGFGYLKYWRKGSAKE